MADKAQGGDDTLIGGTLAEFNTLYGDAERMLGKAVGGNDYLVGGTRSHAHPQ